MEEKCECVKQNREGKLSGKSFRETKKSIERGGERKR